MVWYYGYRFKWKYSKRITKQYGMYSDNCVATDTRVFDLIRKHAKCHFRLYRDCRGFGIIGFHESEKKGDLTGLRAHPVTIKAIGKFLLDKPDAEARWYTDDYDADPDAEEESSEDEDVPVNEKAKAAEEQMFKNLPPEFIQYLDEAYECYGIKEREHGTLTLDGISHLSLKEEGPGAIPVGH